MSGVRCFHIDKVSLIPVRQRLERYSQGNTIKGTQSFHYFEPAAVGSIRFKRTSDDVKFARMHRFFMSSATYDIQDFSMMSYIAVYVMIVGGSESLRKSIILK